LDGYRGIAILMVICFHYFDGLKIFRPCWIGVDLFFMLSGFLITARLLEYYHPQKKQISFWGARAAKILPPLFLLFIGYFILLPQLATTTIANDIRINAADKWWYFSFTQNWLYTTHGYPAVPHLAFLWSLAVQVQFYILIFIITLFTRKPAQLLIVSIVLLLIAATWRTNMAFETTDGSFAHYMYNTFTRFDTFLGGVILYCLLALGKLKYKAVIFSFILSSCGLLLIGFMRRGFDFSDAVSAGPGIFFIIPFAAALLYFTFTNKANIIRTISQLQVFTFPGRISYGLYLYHIPVFTFLSGRLYGKLATVTGNGLFTETLTAVICLITSFVLAWCSYQWLEKPLLMYQKKVAEQ
jgi:peptidoglycan/LPS O-acetylase OafA/YrhL